MSAGALSWDIATIPVVIIGGTVLHFCFDRLGRRRLVAAFCPVNESVWEHLKMAYWPVLAATLIQIAVGAGSAELIAARAVGAIAMCATIIGFYYVTAVLVPRMSLKARLITDGSIFIVAVIVGQLTCHLLLKPLSGIFIAAAVAVMAIPGIVLTITTFAPPRTSLFEDQVTGGYGLARER